MDVVMQCHLEQKIQKLLIYFILLQIASYVSILDSINLLFSFTSKEYNFSAICNTIRPRIDRVQRAEVNLIDSWYYSMRSGFFCNSHNQLVCILKKNRCHLPYFMILYSTFTGDWADFPKQFS
ncbi:unnamed protein product [Paramecium octaurelia]|uniref:Uncharacterized protein n=1 Tax=Paramecium octaurelia TaxID=43137 RepID=A0A8S1STS7_PAROT|nr:unnamed protein product [Paramecium octaurelia]